ncbi:hypothetical protein PMIN05_001156 [Paraphaeosphaeria minitans]
MPELKDVLEEALPAEIQAVLDAQQSEVENAEDRRPFFYRLVGRTITYCMCSSSDTGTSYGACRTDSAYGEGARTLGGV